MWKTSGHSLNLLIGMNGVPLFQCDGMPFSIDQSLRGTSAAAL
jgi:hypothetical protein